MVIDRGVDSHAGRNVVVAGGRGRRARRRIRGRRERHRRVVEREALPTVDERPHRLERRGRRRRRQAVLDCEVRAGAPQLYEGAVGQPAAVARAEAAQLAALQELRQLAGLRRRVERNVGDIQKLEAPPIVQRQFGREWIVGEVERAYPVLERLVCERDERVRLQPARAERELLEVWHPSSENEEGREGGVAVAQVVLAHVESAE